MLHRLKPSTMEDNPLWLIVLCDLMTNLMLFFCIMFAMNRQSAEVRAEFAKTFAAGGVLEESGGKDDVKEVLPPDPAETLKGLIDEGTLRGAVELLETEDSIRVRLKNEILFRSGRAELGPEAAASMKALSELLAQMPNTVVVEGHTDSLPVRSGPFQSNWQLSIARSHAVIAALAGGGVPAARLVAAGYGEFHPVEDNNTPENRAANRRVEVVVLRTREDL
jgi:chemotaxis protein MotB